MKGMAHTPFAIFGVTMLMMLFLIPLNSVPDAAQQNVKSSEAANAQAHNVERTFREGIGITASNFIEASNQYVLDQGFVSDAESAVNFDEGEFDGQEMNFVDYTEWLSGLGSKYDDRGHDIEYEFSGLAVQEGLKLRGGADINYNFSHSPSSTVYRTSSRVNGVEGLRGPDPLLADASAGAFTPQYSYCGFDAPAQQLVVGGESSTEVAHGYAVVQPDEISPQGSEILVVRDASEYSSTELSDFNGVIAGNQSSVQSGDYAHVTGLNTSSIADGDSIIINEDQVWRSHFRKTIDDNCYISTSNGPGVFNRMEGDFSISENGLATFVGSQSNSTELNEAYLYYGPDNGSTVSVKGVSSTDYGDTYSWFRISQENIDEWGLTELGQ